MCLANRMNHINRTQFRGAMFCLLISSLLSVLTRHASLGVENVVDFIRGALLAMMIGLLALSGALRGRRPD